MSATGRYLIAVGFTAAALLLRWLVDPWLGNSFPLVTLFAAVAAAVVASGYRAAIAAALIGYLVGAYLFIEPRGAFGLYLAPNLAGLAAYLFTCAVIIALGEGMRVARKQAQARQEALRITLASIGDAVITTDTAGRVSFLNAIAESLTGWSQREAESQPLEKVFRIINEDTRETVESPVTKSLRNGAIVGLGNHTLLVAKDGTERPIDDSAAPIRNQAGHIAGCVLTFRDVSLRRETEHELLRNQRELNDFFDSATVGLHQVGPDGIILRANRSELTLLGYDSSEYIGQHIEKFHVDKPVIDDILTRLTAGQTLVDYPARLRHKDGSVVEVLIGSSVLFEDGKFVHTRCFTRDITARKRAEEALSRSEATLTMALKASRTVAWSWDLRNGAVVHSSNAADVLGLSVQIDAAALWEAVHPDDIHRLRMTIERTILDRSEFSVDVRLIRPDNGRIIWMQNRGSVECDQSGEPVRIVGTAMDISERKAADQELQDSHALVKQTLAELQATYAHSPIGMLQLDTELRYVRINDAFAAMNGVPAAEHVGKTIWEIVPDLAPKMAPEFRRVIETGEPVLSIELEGETQADPGVRHTWLESWFPVRNAAGKVTALSLFALDITQRRQAEQALRDADRRKDEFLATLAHELRNPLASIRNSIGVLKRADTRPELFHRARDTLDRQFAHMVRLIDDLLDVSRISQDKLALQKSRVDVAGVISQALETVRPMVEAKNHRVTVEFPDAPVFVNADPVRLTQILSNLLNNACKFTPHDGSIVISAAVNDGRLEIAIKDSGVGIAADKLGSVFEMFSQVEDSLDREHGGLGIGLSLVKRLIELHDGAVSAHSDGPGCGSEFVVSLPVDVSAQNGAGPTRINEGALGLPAGFRVLVVDDNQDAATTLSMLLTLQDIDNEIAFEGPAAVTKCASYRPHVVLLDIGLPKMNGFEVCRTIRTLPHGKDLRIYALTGWGQQEDRRKTEEAGFDGHLVKPVEPAKLMQVLAAARPTTRMAATAENF